MPKEIFASNAGKAGQTRMPLKPEVGMQPKMLSFLEARELLSRYNIHALGTLATSREGAEKAAQGHGSVAMKAISGSIVHKSEEKAVILSVPEQFAGEKYDVLSLKFSGRGLDGVLVQPMKSGIEILVGATRSDSFGPVVTVGLGGYLAEGLKELKLFSHGVADITREEAIGMIERAIPARLLGEYRKKAELDKGSLADLIVGVSRLMRENPEISEMDLNPVIWDGKEFSIVDPRPIKGEVKPEVKCEPMPKWAEKSLDALFHPKSCALFGASTAEGGIPDTIVKEILQSFEGDVYLVSPKFSELNAEVRAYKERLERCCGETKNIRVFLCPGARELPYGIDTGVFVTKAQHIPESLGQFAKNGGKSGIIISQGFSEQGNDSLEKQVIGIARSYELLVVGGNCLGVVADGLKTFFIAHDRTEPARMGGRIAYFSQSGGDALGMSEAMSLNKGRIFLCASVGNAKCAKMAYLVQYAGMKKEIGAIGAYVEGVDSLGLFHAVREASKKKPVILSLGGRSEQGKKEVLSHTGGLTDNPAVSEGALLQAGAFIVNEEETMQDLMVMLSTQPAPRGKSVAVVSYSGGHKVRMTDKSEEFGLPISRFGEGTAALIHKIKGMEKAGRTAALDINADATNERVIAVLDELNEASEVGAITFMMFPMVPSAKPEELLDALADFCKRQKKPVIFMCGGASKFIRRFEDGMHERGVPVFTRGLYDTSKALKAFMGVHERYPGLDLRPSKSLKLP